MKQLVARPRPKNADSPPISRTPEYRTWNGMMHRCYSPKNPGWKNYGGRGIEVCDRWRFGADGLSGFECFLLDMGCRPPGLTIERRNNDLGYSKENCVWADHTAQA